MLLTIAFATSFEFVSWTIPSPAQSSGLSGCLPSSLYTFPAIGAWLGIIILRCNIRVKTSPNLTDFHLKIAFQAALQCSFALCYNWIMKKIITCAICNKPLSGKQKLYCSISCKNKDHQSYEAQQARGLRRKKLIVRNLGGCCSMCGYNKNLSALTFHHKYPKKKSFKLDMRSLSNRKESRIKLELVKCILVCHNCHSELHNPQHNFE